MDDGHRILLAAAFAGALLSGALSIGPPADAALGSPRATQSSRADSSPTRSHAGASPVRSPSGPPLTGSAGAPSAGEAAGEGSGAAGFSEVDPLLANGLGSPLCSRLLGGEELSAPVRSHCETSGFAAAPAPTGDYGVDVHIDTGVLGLSSGGLLSVVQTLFVSPLWLALVWAVHALIVMVEWAFAIDVLDSAAAGGIGRGLRQMQAVFTTPWLSLVLAVAAVLAVYNGLVRRRVAETLGQSLMTLAMMAGALWVMADPTGTVGSLGVWANQASLGTLSVAAQGTAASGGGVLGESLESVYATTIEAPWCYLEFGDVSWCRDPARLDHGLHLAALGLAAERQALVGCTVTALLAVPCAAPGSPQARSLEHGTQLLREARSNGAIFLALPANGPERNSINDGGSLLHRLCGSSDATHCRGPTAAQAEFRTDGGTWPRVAGLLLIALGLLGMLLLYGFIALRLLAAATFSLLYLLLAPAAALAPAFGETGRAVFRRWGGALVGAVVSKLLFAFILGVVLAVGSLISSIPTLGWWTQWLLLSSFWWSAFARRNQALALTRGALSSERANAPRALAPRVLVRRVSGVLRTPARALRAGQRAGQRWSKSRDRGAPAVPPRDSASSSDASAGRPAVDEQAARSIDVERREARALWLALPEMHARDRARRAQLGRIRAAESSANARGDRRRGIELAVRRERIEREVAEDRGLLGRARDGRAVDAGSTRASTREQAIPVAEVTTRGDALGHGERTRYLDAQARLPGMRRSDSASRPQRDYQALASLVGIGAVEYRQLAEGPRRAVRLQVDRELDLRRELRAPALGPSSEDGQATRADLPSHPPPTRPNTGESPIMRDAREVAAGRKRQLGLNRP